MTKEDKYIVKMLDLLERDSHLDTLTRPIFSIVRNDPKRTTFSNKGMHYTYLATILDENGKVIIVIDYDGDHFGKDYAIDMKKDIRISCRPKGSKLLVLLSNMPEFHVQQWILKYLQQDEKTFFEDRFKTWISRGYFWYKDVKDFNTPDILLKDWSNLKHFTPKTSDTKSYSNVINGISNIGMTLIKYFHPSIYRCRMKDRQSPENIWYHQDKDGNFDLLLQMFNEHRMYLDWFMCYRVIQMFETTDVAPRIPILTPSRAKLLLYKYAGEFNEIFNPFSGFSSVLLAATSLGKKYLGYDINRTVVHESQCMIEWFEKHKIPIDAHVDRKDAFIDNDSNNPFQNTSNTYGCLFSCPPNGDTEIYYDNMIQEEFSSSYSCEQWVQWCLDTYKCKRYIFVVDSRCNKFQGYVQEILTTKRVSRYPFSTHEKVLVFDR